MATIETYARPGRLYRYRSLGSTTIGDEARVNPKLLDRELDAIENRYIYCPIFTRMNDPMEGFYRASTRLARRPDYEDLVESIRRQKVRLGIASLCESWSNELMWAHYADSFRGICISYSFTRLLEGLPESCALSRIAYGDKPYHLITADLERDERPRSILSTKSLRWSYEREWRLFAERSGRVRYDNAAVSSVYLGARMAEPDRAVIRNRLHAIGVPVRETHVDGYAVERSKRDRDR
ncbi:MAG TPA: DUF2971 domain-containing protein [Allosphingosinicella sp.]|jgi:hypothetical protein